MLIYCALFGAGPTLGECKVLNRAGPPNAMGLKKN